MGYFTDGQVDLSKQEISMVIITIITFFFNY